MKLHRFIFFFYYLSIVGLFLYSYTQVDLSLTLSRASLFQTIEKGFQYIGYFQRPLSTGLYITLLIMLFGSYFGLIYLAVKKKIQRKLVWITILISACLLAFSYNAFSYDLFNYIFYGKLITHYHVSPYQYRALDFPHDPMLSFMHWTHNTYPYGPLWLIFTTPLSFIGNNIFIVTLFLYKLFIASCFVGSVYFLEKIAKKVVPQKSLLVTILFAYNPLILIETLVSSHNDTTMLFLAIFSTYMLLERKWLLGFILMLASFATKQATAFLVVPAAIYSFQLLIRKEFLSQKRLLQLFFLFSLGGYLYVITQIEIQPWYFLWIFPFFLLVSTNKYLLSIMIGYSLGLLLRYEPYLYQGDWNGNAALIKTIVTATTPVIFLAVTLLYSVCFRKHDKK